MTSANSNETASRSIDIINDDEDDFQDACDTETATVEMDLDTALEQAKMAINFFFNNKFDEARSLMKPWAHCSMYHSVGNCVFSFLEAMLTFEQQHILEAADALKLCLSVCQKFRKKNTITESIGKTFRKINYDHYTEMEIHAELCSAEALLLKALLTFIEDETLASFIKGGIKIRTCFNSYKECSNILNQRNWTSNSSKLHFESGVRMGVGTFNLMISLLPGRVIKLLEFMGFSGNKQSGMADLILGSEMTGIRQVLCVMTLLGYHLIVCYVLSHQEGDLEFCDKTLREQLAVYPNGVWFLFFKGRLEFMKGNLDEAIIYYKKSWKSQDLWPQFHHLCFWELLWVNCLKLNWREAMLYATYLVEKSKWSRTIYTYQKACIMCMIPECDLSSSELKTIDNLMTDAPKYKQRIAGKSLPMEKFACKKTLRYFSQKKKLPLPAIELMYLWNLFKILKNHFQLADNLLKIIDKELIENDTINNIHRHYDADNHALVLMLKGACLRQMNSPLQSMKCLETCIGLQKSIKEDFYIIPFAVVEMALLHADEGQLELAIEKLEDAKKSYTGYSLESRLHFRIHTALLDLRIKLAEKDNMPTANVN